MLKRRIATTLLFIFALIFAFIFFLFNGIKINSFSFGQIYISQLYIKLDKKLIVNIEEIKLNTDSKVQSSYEDLATNIKKIPTILKFFEKIDIELLVVDGNRFKILFDNDHIYLDNKFLNLSTQYKKAGSEINLELYSLYLKDINLLFRGKIKLDYFEDVASFYGNYLLNHKIEGELNTQLSSDNIDFYISTQKIKNIKFLKQLFRLDKIAEAWMYDNVTGDMQLNYLSGKLNPNTFEPVLNSIKGEAVINNASIVFNKKVAPVKTSKLTIRYSKDNLNFDLYKPTYKKLSIDGSQVNISNLTNKKGRVDVLIKTKEVLGNDILTILKAYDITLPIKQKSGKTNAEVLLKIPYIKPMQTFGTFKLKNSKLLINNQFEFYSKQANVELKNSKVIIKSSNFKIDKLMDSTIDLTIDINKLNAKGNAIINDFVIKSNESDVVNLNGLKTPFTIDFKKKTIIDIQKIKTKIVLNKENTKVIIDSLQTVAKYSKVLKENNLNRGNLNLYIYDANIINFDGKIKNLDLPIKRGERKVTSINLTGKLRNKNISIASKKKDIIIDIKENEELKITLKDMNIYPLMKVKKTTNNRLNVRLINSIIYLEDEIYYPKDLNVLLDKGNIYFDGQVQNLDLPIMYKDKKVTSLNLKGSVIGDKIELESKDKKVYAKVLNEKDYLIKLNKIDLIYNIDDKTDSNKNYHVIGKNSNIIINNKFKALSTKYDFVIDEKSSKFDLDHKNTKMSYVKDEDSMITLNIKNVSDVFINTFFNKDIVEGGTLNIHAVGKSHILTGRINFQKNKIKNLKTLNNIIMLLNTSPALLNPFLAIPSIFDMVSKGGFNINGYRVNKGYVDFTYNSRDKYLNMYDIKTEGNSVDFDGFTTFDFKKDKINGDIKLVFMKGYSDIIDYIPAVDYILLGDDKKISTLINIRGKIEEPELKTNVLKDSATIPFDILKRILTLPFKPFMD